MSVSGQSRSLRSMIGHGGYAVGMGGQPLLAGVLDEIAERVAVRVAELLQDRPASSIRDGSVELLSVAEAAEVLRCKPQRVYDLRCAGRLPKTTEGGRAVVRRSDLEGLVDEAGR